MGFLRRFHPKSVVGNRGEDMAVVFLRSLGYRILDRNYRNDRGRAVGEVDIVARDGNELVFVEVKTRTVHRGGDRPLPEESIAGKKLHRLERVAEAYLREKGLASSPYRFDAVLIVVCPTGGKPEIRHFKSIFL